MDYGKYKYQEAKSKKQKAKNVKLKNIQIRLATSDHDLETKIRNAQRFLKKGHKVRIAIQLRGREKAHQDLAKEKLQEFITQIEEKIRIEQPLKKFSQGFETIISQ